MHKLAFSGLFAAVAVSTAAVFAGSTPIRVVTTPTTPVLKLKAPPTMTRVAPLPASALAAALAQARAAYPKALTATSSAVLTLDAAHWYATAGTLSGALTLVSPTSVGTDLSGSPAAWTMDSNSMAYLMITGMQTGGVYLLDCGTAASDGTSVALMMCPGADPMGCWSNPGSASGANLSVSNNHALYAFSPTQGAAMIGLGNANGLTMTSCSLHPVS